MADPFCERYAPLLEGSYDCVDRIVLNGYFILGQNAGGFRTWWRRLYGTDENLNNTTLMRLAGRFSRRVQAYARKCGVMLRYCKAGERKHELAHQFLPTDPQFKGLFLILVSKAPAPVWEVLGKTFIRRKKPYPYVNHYSFHIIDPEWGHITIKLCGHAPFTGQIILNGHEFVARQAAAKKIGFQKEDNCFTVVSNAADLAKVADALRCNDAIGRLSQVCERWIYSTCLCFALDSAEREKSGFHYDYSLYQGEYSRNLLFRDGAQMDVIFDGLIDRTRALLKIPALKTIFGCRVRPHRNRKGAPARCESAVEIPVYDLTVFKLHFGAWTVKLYTKGERVLRIEALLHNAGALPCGRSLPMFPEMIAGLRSILERFLEAVRSIDAPFVDAGALEALPQPTQLGRARVGGVDMNKSRVRALLEALITLAALPEGFAVADLAAQVRVRLETYTVRQAAYDLRKVRGKGWVQASPGTRHYVALPDGLRTMTALLVLRDKVIKPLLAGALSRGAELTTKHVAPVDQHYRNLRLEMNALFRQLGIAA